MVCEEYIYSANKMNKQFTPKPTPEERSKLIKQNLAYLSYAFKDAVEKYKTRTGDNKNTRGTVLHTYQTDFAYAINEIQKGPEVVAQQYINDANDIIVRLNGEQKKS